MKKEKEATIMKKIKTSTKGEKIHSQIIQENKTSLALTTLPEETSVQTKPNPNIIKLKLQVSTKEENTWCPGCPNFMILEAVKRTLSYFIDIKKHKHEDFAIT